MIKMSRKAKKAMAVALTAGMLASTAATPVMAATAGWKQNTKGWWYENADGTYPANKWQSIGEKWYYFDANGYMVSDWKQINGKWYYFGGANDGAMKDGWFQDTTGKWSYAVPGNGAITQDGWAKSAAGEWFYLKADGYMQEGGWAKNNGKWYFLRNDGVMQTGIIDVEGEVFYLNADGDMFVGEKTIGEVTYKFDSYGKAVGDKIPTATKAFKKDGTPVAVKPEERELSVTAVTAITVNENKEFVVTALLSDKVTADTLKDTTLTLTNGSIVVTAAFDSVNGSTAVYKIANSSALTPGDSSADGSYAVTGNGIDVATGLTASYGETLVGNAIQGIVYYNDAVLGYTPLKNATVKVGNKTTTTDENGYYNIYASSGVVSVNATASLYFGNTVSTNVSRNYTSAQNIELTAYDQDKLFVNGTVVDEKTSAAVGGATVTLKKKNSNGEYVEIAKVTTGTDGKYVFKNFKATVGNAYVANGDGATKVFNTDDSNKLSEKESYKIVISKDYKADLYNAYHTQEYDVTMSQTGAQTNLKTKTIKPVEKLASATLAGSWNKDITLNDNETTNLIVTFKDQDGKTTLGKVATVAVETEKQAVKADENLVGQVFTKAPTLPSGTYAFVVSDVAHTNVATEVVVVKVEEGKDLKVVCDFTKATDGTINTTVSNFTYTGDVKNAYKKAEGDSANVIDTEGVANGDPLTVKYEVYQKTAEGLDVLVYTTEASKFAYAYKDNDANNAISVNASTSVIRLEAGKEYKCVPAGDYITLSNITVKNANTDASFTEPHKVLSAGKIETIDLSDVKFVEADGETKYAGMSKILSVKLIGEDGKVVAEASELKKDDKYVLDESFKVADLFKDASDLARIPAGKYKLEIKVDGFESFTTDEFKLVDFQAKTVAPEKTVKAIAKTQLSGSLRYSNGTVVEEAVSIIVLDESGVVVAAQKDTDGDGLYKLEDDGTNVKLSAGIYTVIVRGAGFETLAKKVQLTANQANLQDIVVDKHAGGVAKLAIRDTNNYGYGYPAGIALLDEYYVSKSDSIRDKYDILEKSGIIGDLLGAYTVNSVKGSDVEFETNESLSKGKYTISIASTLRAYGNSSNKISIDNVNGTSYANIVLSAKQSEKLVPLTVKYSASAADADEWVVVKDVNGTVIGIDNDAENDDWDDDSITFQVGENATYVVTAYVNGKVIGTEEITIQDFAKSVTVSLDNAERS